MKKTYLTLLMACTLSFLLSQNNKNNLRALTNSERLKYVEKGLSFGPSTLFIINNTEISRSDFRKRNDTKDLFPEFYVDSIGNIKEIHFRQKVSNDSIFSNKYKEAHLAYSNKEKKSKFSEVQVNCDSAESVLEDLFDKDQLYRNNDYLSSGNLHDIENRNLLLNILNKCDTSLFETYSKKAMWGFWVVIQHSELNIIEKYFPFLKRLERMGRIKTSFLNMMEDRILVSKGKAQKHGTQFKVDPYSKKKEYYD